MSYHIFKALACHITEVHDWREYVVPVDGKEEELRRQCRACERVERWQKTVWASKSSWIFLDKGYGPDFFT
jgi:hypothetical protein